MADIKIALAQIDSTVGDFVGNGEKILGAAQEARRRGADLLITPELALSGYPPEDLLLRPDFYRASQKALAQVVEKSPLPILVGHPEACDGAHYNAASLVHDGRLVGTYRKQRLPTYEVFDEARYFRPGNTSYVFELKGVRFGVNICADVWSPEPAAAARNSGAQVLLALNASPFHRGKQTTRETILRRRVEENGIPVLYCNLVGGQDELVFDGASFALDAGGELALRLPFFEEALGIVEYRDGRLCTAAISETPPEEALVYTALKLGVADYLGKNGFPGAIVGLSGGIDSALTLAIAVDALGAEKVRAVMMPSPYTAPMSIADARTIAANLGVEYDEIPIEGAMREFSALLAPLFARLGEKPAWDTTEENIQARIRGLLLMAISNRTGRIVLTTGNKSEMAVGYATLYGDMAGGFAVIKDVPKTLVYRLARYRNSIAAVIPENVLQRPPSAELKPDQTDQDTLPPYDVLDAIVEGYMERDESPRELIAKGLPHDAVRRVVSMLKKNEYKRRQAPPGIRISRRAFGKDWRYPITSQYADEWSES
ncbi:MAG: NAD+ synthase [Rhodocyclaceae bacterium]|nr:NAD+ synthase [Rhodocyclaceae bacterium]